MKQQPLLNRRGEPVQEFTATAAKNLFGQVLEHATRDGMVTITRREQPLAVVLSLTEYQALLDADRPVLEALRRDFDSMAAAMNAPGAGDRTLDIFSSSPEQIGRLALKAARRVRG